MGLQNEYHNFNVILLKATLLGCFGEWSALPLPAKLPMGNFEPNRERQRRMLLKRKNEEELVPMVVKIPKYKKEMIQKVVEKTSYNTASDLIRAGIEKELNLQIYKDNLDFIIKELDKLIEAKLDPFIKSQRKINVKNLRTNAINTYLVGEVFSKILGDDMHKEFLKILSEARKKANYFVNKDTTGLTEKDLYDFYYIGDPYRNE